MFKNLRSTRASAHAYPTDALEGSWECRSIARFTGKEIVGLSNGRVLGAHGAVNRGLKWGVGFSLKKRHIKGFARLHKGLFHKSFCNKECCSNCHGLPREIITCRVVLAFADILAVFVLDASGRMTVAFASSAHGEIAQAATEHQNDERYGNIMKLSWSSNTTFLINLRKREHDVEKLIRYKQID